MEKYEDNCIRFSIPENSEVSLLEIDSKKIYGLTAFEDSEQKMHIDISLEDANPYMGSMDVEALLNIYSTNMPNHTVLHHDMLVNNNGTKIFYIVQKHQEEVDLPYSVSFYFPVGETEASYSVMSSYNRMTDKKYEFAKDIVKEIAKSIEIKNKDT